MPPRATLCDPPNNIHNWISIGPTNPKQLCDCKKLRREQKTEETKHSPSIFVNGIEVGQLYALAQHLVDDGPYVEFEAQYNTADGWRLLLVDENYAPAGHGATLAEAVAALAENESNSEG